MSTLTMTMIGAYKYDPTIFDELILPDGIDRDTAINTMLIRCGEFELLYPDIDFLKDFIGLWSKKWYRTFGLWLTGTEATWNPIENYDRYEDFTDTGSSSKTTKGSHGETSSETVSSSNTLTGSNGGTVQNDVSAYDASTFQPSSKETTSNTSSSGSTGSSTTSGTNGLTINDTETGSDSNVHSGHIHGNIGVTQSSEMLKNWYDISSWNLYEHIADVFVAEVCIPIY